VEALQVAYLSQYWLWGLVDKKNNIEAMRSVFRY